MNLFQYQRQGKSVRTFHAGSRVLATSKANSAGQSGAIVLSREELQSTAKGDWRKWAVAILIQKQTTVRLDSIRSD